MKPAIVVTGASSGIGRELARIAARDKSFMVLVDRSGEALDQLAAELNSSGTQAQSVCVDLLDPAAGERIENALSERGLYCDVLVNSAGIGLIGRAAEIPRAGQLSLLDVNARALTDLTLRFLPGMIARRRGGVLNIGSISAYAPGPYLSVYTASKAYVKSLSAALAAETAGTGVRVTCLSPGIVRTSFMERLETGRTRLFTIMPSSDAYKTAKAGWHGFRAGKSVVVPRLADRLTMAFCVLMPDSILASLMLALQRPRGGSSIQAAPQDGRHQK